MRRRTIAVIAISLMLIITVGTLLWLLPVFSAPTVNSSWIVAYNANDAFDTWSATRISIALGAQMVDINTGHYDWNSMGKSIIVVGGSKSLSQVAPWQELYPMSTMKEPNTYPSAYWDLSDGLHDYIRTPSTTYTYTGVSTDYGLIARGYDYGLRRWVVSIIGGDAEGTAAGVKYALDVNGTFSSGYAVYQCILRAPKHDSSTWVITNFGYSVLEVG